jgi:uncharacterized YigZ family protein
MAETDHYQTIEQMTTAEYKDKGSRFLAYAFPVLTMDDFKAKQQWLKKEHPKAVHHCFGYRLGLDGNSFRVSDDGEPGGSAGKPILGQIDSKKLTNVAVIVVRYFGGTLLGVPGLIQAYKTATVMALQLTPVIQKPIEVLYELQFDYTRMNEVMTLVKQMDCSIAGQQEQLFVLLTIGIPKARLQEALYRLKDMHYVTTRKI